MSSDEERQRDDEARDDPHDSTAEEPLGPVTPDEESEAGDTPEVHDSISPHDLPKDHPGRQAAERIADEEGGGEAARGNV